MNRRPSFPQHRLDVYRVAVELAQKTREAAKSIPRGDRPLADRGHVDRAVDCGGRESSLRQALAKGVGDGDGRRGHLEHAVRVRRFERRGNQGSGRHGGRQHKAEPALIVDVDQAFVPALRRLLELVCGKGVEEFIGHDQHGVVRNIVQGVVPCGLVFKIGLEQGFALTVAQAATGFHQM